MAATTVKPEIKLDPASEPTNMSQLDEFEEDTDLHIPDPSGPQAWLVKVPEHLWKAWNEIYRTTADEQPIEIGKMRVYNAKEGETPLQQKIQIKLNAGVPQHVELPKNYTLDLKSEGYNNTVVFSEKDLPGHQTRRDVAGRARAHLRPSGIPSKAERYGTNKPGTYRSAIPKQTALAPIIHHQADATPVQDASYDAYIEKAYKAAMQPKRKTHITHGLDRGMHPGNRSANFTLTSRVGAGRKPPPKEKAVRMSQTDLLDRIYKCFGKYKYWSLRALRNELKQPETFIKETLESIAVLVRSGDFAMNYKLRDEYAIVANIKPEEVKDENAVIKSEDEGSVAEDAEMEDDDDDEDGEDFEDVKMEE
jgi:transcription initiation factor TFIIF subunit beta